MQPIRVTKKQACELLSIKANALESLITKDPDFPRPYKYGNARQSPVYFDYADLVNWHNQQKEKSSYVPKSFGEVQKAGAIA